MVVDKTIWFRFPEDSMLMGRWVQEVKPSDIESIEILKGAAAYQQSRDSLRDVLLVTLNPSARRSPRPR
jgi:hypothetical protein